MLKCIESLTSPINLLYKIDANYSQFAKILPQPQTLFPFSIVNLLYFLVLRLWKLFS